MSSSLYVATGTIYLFFIIYNINNRKRQLVITFNNGVGCESFSENLEVIKKT